MYCMRCACGLGRTSDRLQNAMAQLSIPLVLSDVHREWLPLQHAVPWSDILVIVDRDRFELNASEAVAQAMSAVSPEERRAIRQRMLTTRPDLLFGVPDSHASERLLQAAMLEPRASCGFMAKDVASEAQLRDATAARGRRAARDTWRSLTL